MTSSPPQSVCVFCGSASGNDPKYHEAASAFGTAVAESGIRLVYGGGKTGLMGAVADAALAAGGKVTGIMPQHLVDREIAHTGLSELITVKSMHERKTLMSDRSEAFVSLPGGAGTLEEVMEQWTWAQLRIHAKPIAFLNVGGYFGPLFTMIDQMVAAGFMQARFAEMVIKANDAPTLIKALAVYDAPPVKQYAQ